MTSTGGRQPGWHGLMAEAGDWIRSEPALSWFFEQTIYVAQPVLEVFWQSEVIERFVGDLQPSGVNSEGCPGKPTETGG